MQYIKRAAGAVAAQVMGSNLPPDETLQEYKDKLKRLESVITVLQKKFSKYAERVLEASKESVGLTKDVSQFYASSAARQKSVQTFVDAHLNLDTVAHRIFKDEFGWEIVKIFDDWRAHCQRLRNDIKYAEELRQRIAQQQSKVKSAEKNGKDEGELTQLRKVLADSVREYSNLSDRLNETVKDVIDGRFATFDQCYVQLMETQLEYHRAAAKAMESFSASIDNFRKRFPKSSAPSKPYQSTATDDDDQAPQQHTSPAAPSRRQNSVDVNGARSPVNGQQQQQQPARRASATPVNNTGPPPKPSNKPQQQLAPAHDSDHEEDKHDDEHEEHHDDDHHEEEHEEATSPQTAPEPPKKAASLLDLSGIPDSAPAPAAKPAAKPVPAPVVDLLNMDSIPESSAPVSSATSATSPPRARQDSFFNMFADAPASSAPAAAPSAKPSAGGVTRSNSGNVQAQQQPQQKAAEPVKKKGDFDDFDPYSFAAQPAPSPTHLAQPTQVARPVSAPPAEAAKRPLRPTTPASATNASDDAKRIADEFRQREADTKAARDQRNLLNSQLNSKLEKWELKDGVTKQLPTLLSTLHTVAWEGSGWQPVNLVDVMDLKGAKKHYFKAIKMFHPDAASGEDEHQVIAQRVFATLNSAWKKMQEEQAQS